MFDKALEAALNGSPRGLSLPSRCDCPADPTIPNEGLHDLIGHGMNGTDGRSCGEAITLRDLRIAVNKLSRVT